MTKEELDLLRQIMREELRSANSEYLTIEEAAEMTKFSKSSLYTYVNQQRIPYIKREGKILFKRSALTSWMDQGSFSPKTDVAIGGVRVRI